MSTSTIKPPVPTDSGIRRGNVCHLHTVLGEWKLDRPLCGAIDATRCIQDGRQQMFTGYEHCPKCGRRVCPTCRAQRPGQ